MTHTTSPKSSATRHDDPLVLTGIFGDFELADLVGRDGPFSLYRARQISLDRPVTLRILVEDRASIERAGLLRREAEAANQLDHPAALRVFEVGAFGGTPFLAMETVDGELLSERLEFGPLPPRQAAEITIQLAETLLHAHEKNVVHGCLRPEAVWITADQKVRVCGFGQVIRLDTTDAGEPATFVRYLAPEQAGGGGVVGKQADIYGLGAVLYSMLTGRSPHQRSTLEGTLRAIRQSTPVAPSRLVPTVPRELDAICARCLHRNPRRRYGSERSLARLIADLHRYLSGKPVRGASPDPWQFLRLAFRRNRRLLAAATLVALAVLAPAWWDRDRRRSEWNVLARDDATPAEYSRAERYFERMRLNDPGDSEAVSGLALAHFRTGRIEEAASLIPGFIVPSGAPESAAIVAIWPGANDEWASTQKLTRALIGLHQGHWADGHMAVKSSRWSVRARSEVERSLYAECAALMTDDSLLLAAIRAGDRNAIYAAADRAPTPELVQALVERLLPSHDPEVRLAYGDARSDTAAAARWVLSKQSPDWPAHEGAARAIPALAAHLGALSVETRKQVADLLRKIDPNWAKSPQARKAIPRLVLRLADLGAARDQSTGVAEAELATLGALEQIDLQWRRSPEIKEILPVLRARLDGFTASRPADRRFAAALAAADVVAMIGPSAADLVPALREKLLHPSERVRIEAFRILAAVEPSWPATAWGKPAHKFVIACLRHANAEVRRVAAEALGRIAAPGGIPAVPDLMVAMTDPDVAVVRAAEAALYRLDLSARWALPPEQAAAALLEYFRGAWHTLYNEENGAHLPGRGRDSVCTFAGADFSLVQNGLLKQKSILRNVAVVAHNLEVDFVDQQGDRQGEVWTAIVRVEYDRLTWCGRYARTGKARPSAIFTDPEDGCAIRCVIRAAWPDLAWLRVDAGRKAVPKLAERLHDADPVVRVRTAWLLARFGSDAASAVPALIERLADRTIVDVPRAADPPALSPIGRDRVNCFTAVVQALNAIDANWVRLPQARNVAPTLIESMAAETNAADPDVAGGIVESASVLDRIDPNWPGSEAAAMHRRAWKAWAQDERSPALQRLGARILVRLDAGK